MSRSRTRPGGHRAAGRLAVRRAAVVLVMASLAACSDSEAPVVSATDATVTTPPTLTSATAAPTSQTSTQPTTPTASVTTTTTTAPPATASTTVAPAPTRTPSASPTDDDAGPRAQWPPALGEPAQGDPVWAVYLATGHSSADAVIDAAVADAAAVGYDAVVGDLACDQGALEALQLDPQDFWTAATLYFATESDVNRFLASYRARVGEVVGYAQISLGCLD